MGKFTSISGEARARARWQVVSAADRSAMGRNAANARWAKVRGVKPADAKPADAVALVASLRSAIHGRPGWQIHDLRLAGIADWLASLPASKPASKPAASTGDSVPF